MQKFLRLASLWLPLPARIKLPLVLAGYRFAGPLFRASAHYQAWQRSRQEAIPVAQAAPAASGNASRGSDRGIVRGIVRDIVRDIVLVIDQYIPRPDRDSGSRAIWQMMESFLEGGYRVSFWPASGWNEPGYTERLQALGIDVVLGPEHARGLREWLRAHAQEHAATLLSRPLLAREYLPLLRAARQGNGPAPILYNGVDIHYQRLALQSRMAGRGPSLEERWMRALEPRMWEQCDIVLYPSDEEVQEVKALRPGVDARRIPLFAFADFPPPRVARGVRPHRLFVVANFAHEPNIDGMRWLLGDVLPRLRELRADFTIEVAGAHAPSSLTAFPAPELRWLGPVSDGQLDDLYRDSDMALVPLRYGAGVKGKVVEALRWGLPLVTTSVGAQGLAGIREFVPVEDDARAFAQAIDDLLADPKGREGRSARMIEYARTRFTRAAMRDALSFIADPASPCAKP